MSRKLVIPVPDWGGESLRFDPKELERRIATTRPTPGEELGEDVPETFQPNPYFAEWIRGTFIDPTGPLSNDRHQHLQEAVIGVLWTNCINTSKQKQILATAEIVDAGFGGKWKRGRFDQQIREWFPGPHPDFILTFYAPELSKCDNRTFCAIVEHELCHCAQDVDKYGGPKFTQEGGPAFALKGHDVEEFTDVVLRYGVTSPDLKEMVAAANRRPFIGETPIDIACGVCAKAAA